MNLVLQINYDAEKLPSFLREVGVNCVEVDVPVADRLAVRLKRILMAAVTGPNNV